MNQKKSKVIDNPVVSIFRGNMGIIAVLVIMCIIVTVATDKFLTANNII